MTETEVVALTNLAHSLARCYVWVTVAVIVIGALWLGVRRSGRAVVRRRQAARGIAAIEEFLAASPTAGGPRSSQRRPQAFLAGARK